MKNLGRIPEFFSKQSITTNTCIFRNPVRLDIFANSASSALSTLEHVQPKREGSAHPEGAARLHTIKKNFINLKRVISYNGANGAALEDEVK